ncbi:MAG TPA: alpha/beta hydrolase, partial [Dehalococcoidia bacterium]|nr:alpha/beta hydrolase [Dehalococcoidia bacterium]
MCPESGFVSANGVRLHYVDWGGAGQPVVLIHATGLVAGVWRHLAEALRGDGYRPVAYDQRGHGDSDKPPAGYTFDVLTADLRDLIIALDLSSVIGIGLSGGATSVALCGADQPGLIDRAILIEPIIFPNRDLPDARAQHTDSMVNRTIKRRAVWSSFAEIFESYRSRPPFASWHEDILRDYLEAGTRTREDGQVELKCPPAIEAQFYDNAPTFDPWDHLRRLNIPTLVIRG